jgi:hypothetical protein
LTRGSFNAGSRKLFNEGISIWRMFYDCECVLTVDKDNAEAPKVEFEEMKKLF